MSDDIEINLKREKHIIALETEIKMLREFITQTAKNHINIIKHITSGNRETMDDVLIISPEPIKPKTKQKSKSPKIIVEDDVYNKRLDLSEEKVRSVMDTYSLEYFNEGVKGMAKWVTKYVLTSKTGELLYSCQDKSKNLFTYINMQGKETEDSHAGALRDLLRDIFDVKWRAYKK
jgi:hypothetical protein